MDDTFGPFDFAPKIIAKDKTSRRSAQGDRFKGMFPGTRFVKADPSLPLRISLGGSDAARTAQDVLFRN
jgi:hypothetical protein